MQPYQRTHYRAHIAWSVRTYALISLLACGPEPLTHTALDAGAKHDASSPAADGGGSSDAKSDAGDMQSATAGKMMMMPVAGKGGAECDLPRTLADFCSRPNRTCPSTPAQAWKASCPGGWGACHYENSCGGTTVVQRYGADGTAFHFDANRKLVGILSYSDVSAAPCWVNQNQYGTACSGPTPYAHLCRPDCSAPDAGLEDDAGL